MRQSRFQESAPRSARFRSHYLILAVATVALIGDVAPLSSQTVSEITPSTFAPAAQRLRGRVVFSGEPGTAAPAGAEDLLITLAGVELDGGLPEMAEANAAIRQRLTRGTISVAEIFNASSDLEKVYAESGFVLSRVVLPAQDLRDGGTLRIVVVDGFIEDIDADAAPARVRARLEGLTGPLIDRPRLRLPEIERQILLAGDTYGVALGSALAAGAQPGAAQLILQPEFRPVTGFLAFDNAVASNLGPLTLSGGVEFNSLLNLGETFYFRLSGAPSSDNDNDLGSLFSDDPRLRTLSAGAVFPIGFDGLTLNVEATDSRSAPDIDSPATTSRFQRLSTRLFYPFIRSRSRNISGQLSLDVQSDEQTLITTAGQTTLYQDDTTVLRIAADGFWETEAGYLIEAGAVLSRGLDILGARSAPPAGLSREGADVAFTKLVASGRLRGAVSENVNFSLAGRLQSSFGDAMVTGEQFGLAGTQELSAFDAGSIKGDSGWVLRGEMSYPKRFDVSAFPVLASPYVFAAYGEAHLENPTVGERSRTEASSFGIGLELNTLEVDRFTSASLRIEYGKGQRNDSLPDNDRFSIVGSFRF